LVNAKVIEVEFFKCLDFRHKFLVLGDQIHKGCVQIVKKEDVS